MLRESNSNYVKGSGLMDYVITGKYNNASIVNHSNSLFITDVDGEKTAHNTYNLGNFLWGAGTAALGIPYIAVFLVQISTISSMIQHLSGILIQKMINYR